MRKLFVVMMVAAMGSLVACGGGSSSGSSTGDSAPEITTIEDLPAATGPMAETASAQLAKAAGVGKEASIGMNLATTSVDFFSGQGASLGACETLNVVTSSISSAAMGDMILCYMKGMANAMDFTQSSDVDVYDGEWHIIHFGEEMQDQDQNSPGKIKFRVAKADGVNVSEFEMFMCSQPSLQYPNGNQMEYIRQTLSGSTVAMNSKGIFKEDNWEGWHAVALDGTLNGAGAYTNKVITMRDTGSGSDEEGNPNTHNQYGVLTQTPGAFEYSGFRAGTFTDENFGAATYTDQVTSAGEMLNDTSTNLLELAMGDGGTFAKTVADVGGTDKGQDDFYDFWNGDTAVAMSGLPAPDGNGYASAVEGVDLIAIEPISIAFDASETWDCTDDVESIIELFSVSKKGPDEIESECTQYNLGHEWMNCYSNVEYVEPPEGEGPQQPEMSCDSDSVCGAAAPEMQSACQDCFANNVGDDAGVYECLTALCTGGSPDPEACSEGAEICNPANL